MSWLPMVMREPSPTRRRPSILVPSTSTPLRLPMSSTKTLSLVMVSSACLRETSGSSSESWHSVLRPIRNCPGASSRLWCK